MLTFNFDPFPILESERLVLRRVEKRDTPQFFELRNLDAVMEYIDRPRQKDYAEIESFIDQIDAMIASNKDINWGITLKGEDVLIGTIGYYRTQHEHYRGEVGYMLHPNYWRQGIMHEALQTVLAFGFQQLHFHTISAWINPLNISSRELLLKNKFVKEAHFKEDFYWNGSFKDTEVYTLFENVFNEKKV